MAVLKEHAITGQQYDELVNVKSKYRLTNYGWFCDDCSTLVSATSAHEAERHTDETGVNE